MKTKITAIILLIGVAILLVLGNLNISKWDSVRVYRTMFDEYTELDPIQAKELEHLLWNQEYVENTDEDTEYIETGWTGVIIDFIADGMTYRWHIKADVITYVEFESDWEWMGETPYNGKRYEGSRELYTAVLQCIEN